jgi:hypothetical protein
LIKISAEQYGGILTSFSGAAMGFGRRFGPLAIRNDTAFGLADRVDLRFAAATDPGWP